MSPEAQRIAIAEACGWKGWYCPKCNCEVPPVQVTYHEYHSDPEDRCGSKVESAPDYLNDLNAMHDAEKVLDSDDGREYREILQDMCGVYEYHKATASQRAEAFLRTIGKWEEPTKQ